MQEPTTVQRRNVKNYFEPNARGRKEKQGKIKRGLKARWKYRDTSEKTKTNEQWGERQNAHSKRRHSTETTSGQETDSNYNSPSKAFFPATKYPLGRQLSHGIKQQDRKKTRRSNDTSKLDFEENNFYQQNLTFSSLSKFCGAKNKLTQSNSFPDLLFEEFTPVITADFDDETYRFQCSSPGLYQCTVTGLVFHMEGGGDVVYRTVPWDRRQLSRHHKKPAGPLFDIQCVQQCVCQLHLPHCEILSTGGHRFLSVAHVTDEGIEFIRPQKITETHVVLNITGFSGYGNVKDEDSPPDPVRALVLLFYRPSKGALESVLNVLLVPRNILVQDVQRTRRKLVGDEMYIDKPPHCKLQPKQLYTLSACPQNRSVRIEPPEAEFDEESHSSYFPNFQVIIRRTKKNITLVLKDKSSSVVVWEGQVCLPSTEERNSYGQPELDLPSIERLRKIRSSFIDGISEPVLKNLLDKLLETKVMTDSERESVDGMDNKRDKARFVIDTVRKKGEAAGSEMIEFLCELDPFLCGHLGLM